MRAPYDGMKQRQIFIPECKAALQKLIHQYSY
jgi:hypothetical protein